MNLNFFEIGREMDLPVFVTFEDGQPNIFQWSLENGTCEYWLKPIPMNVLNMVSTYMFFKKHNKWAQVQQPTNNVSRVRNQRMSWTPDSHEKFVKSAQKLGGADNATPKKILQPLQSNFTGFEDVDSIKVSSHLQKYRKSLKKKKRRSRVCWGAKTDGTSSEHIQSRYQMEEHPPLTSVDQVLKTTVANEPDMLSQQQQAPAAKNTQGFHSVTWPSETNLHTIGGSTSCGNQSNALMTQMDGAFSSEQMRNESTGGQPLVYKNFLNDIDASTNDISGDPGFFSINDPLLSPLHIDYGEHGFYSNGIFENFTGDVIAPEHFNNL